MKITLNKKYEHLRPYLLHIEEHFEQEGHEIYRDRNVLRTLRVGELTLCVKRYAHTPLLRSGNAGPSHKGRQAYFRPLQLRERGYESPEPVAYVVIRKGLLKRDTYFVCLHSPYRYTLQDVGELPAEQQQRVAEAFARWAARLHSDGFLHRDFSGSNILFDKVNERYHFALVDTNSLRRSRSVSPAHGLENLRLVGGPAPFRATVARVYAEARGLDPARCEGRLLSDA